VQFKKPESIHPTLPKDAHAPFAWVRNECAGLARTIYILCIYGVFGREITKYTVIYIYGAGQL